MGEEKEIKNSEPVYVVIDIETTGKDSQIDRICEICAIKLSQGKQVDKFHARINPQKDISFSAFMLHRISPVELKDAPTFEQIAQKLRDFLNQAVIVGQNVKFDIEFLNTEFKRCGLEEINPVTIDTIELAKQLFPGMKTYNLSALASYYGIEFPKVLQHRADTDCQITCEIFLRSLELLKNRFQ